MPFFRDFYRPREPLNIWQWNARYTDFSLCPSHETNIKTKYDPDVMPCYKEPCEALTDLGTREVIILKPSRAMATESVCLNALRYHVEMDPLNVLLVGADEKWVEAFFKKRIIKGLEVNRLTAKKLAAAHTIGMRIEFPDCEITADFPGSRSVAKGFGYALVIGTEISLWGSYVADMLRKRLATHRFGHLLLESAPDPQKDRDSKDDPIFVEYKKGDQCVWTCTDPATKEPFVFQLGGKKSHGLKWDKSAKREDGTWDLNRVAETAYYETPGGARIENHQRLAIARAGYWVPTNSNAEKGVRSFKVSAMSAPFYTSDFGHLAVKFLEAKHAGQGAMRTYKYEYWGDEYINDNPSYSVEWGAIWQFRDMLKYARGTVPNSKWFKLWLMIDVQKLSVPWAVWAISTDGIYLIDHGTALNFDDMTALLDRKFDTSAGDFAAIAGCVIDTGHKPDECYAWIRQNMARALIVPVKGNEKALTGGEIYKWGLPLQNHPWVRILAIHSTHWHDLAFRTLTKVEPEEGQTLAQAWAVKQIPVYFHDGIDQAYAQELRNEWVEEEVNENTGAIRRIAKFKTPHDQFDLFRYVLIARSLMANDLAAEHERAKQADKKDQPQTPQVKKHTTPKRDQWINSDMVRI